MLAALPSRPAGCGVLPSKAWALCWKGRVRANESLPAQKASKDTTGSQRASPPSPQGAPSAPPQVFEALRSLWILSLQELTWILSAVCRERLLLPGLHCKGFPCALCVMTWSSTALSPAFLTGSLL